MEPGQGARGESLQPLKGGLQINGRVLTDSGLENDFSDHTSSHKIEALQMGATWLRRRLRNLRCMSRG